MGYSNPNPLALMYGNAGQILAQNGDTGPAASIAGQSISANGGAPALQSQAGLMNALQQQSAGTGGPTLAQNQLQQGLAGGLQTNLAAAAAQRGNNNPGVANKQLGENQVAQNAQATGVAAQTRAQGQITAQGQLAGVQGQSLSEAQAQAGLNQQASLANQAAQEQWLQQVYGLTSANTAAANQWLSPQIILGGVSGAGQGLSSLGGMTGGSGSSGAVSGLAASDEQTKVNIQNSGAQTQSFLNSLTAANENLVGTALARSKVADKDVPAALAPPPAPSQPQSLNQQQKSVPKPVTQAPPTQPVGATVTPPTAPTPSVEAVPAINSPAISSPAISGPVSVDVSDEDEKANVSSTGDRQNNDFLGNIDNKSYNYKDPSLPGAADGTHFGPMAQTLQQSDIGNSVVSKGDDGVLRVDTGRLSLALAGALGTMHKRLSALEAKKTSKKKV